MLPRELRQYSNRKVFLTLGAIIGVSFTATIATLIALTALTAVRHTASVNNSARAQLQALLLDLRTAESSNRGYVITNDPNYLSRYAKALADAKSSLAQLDVQTAQASYRDDFNLLKPLVISKLAALDNTVKLKQSDGQEAGLIANLDGSRAIMDQIEVISGRIENRQTVQLNQDRKNVQAWADIARDISVLTLALTLALAGFMYYLYLKAIQSERQLDRAKDEFVSLASHQLRTPATGIKSILSTLVAGDFGPLNERQSYFMRRALESNERELGIIEELLNVAKADAGRLILHCTEFELGKLIDAIAGEQRGVIDQKNQNLTIKQPNHPLKIYADEEKLYMAIGNLLDNARKYTPEFGKISVAIYSRHGEVHVEVADTGVGIDPDELEHIFDRFQRATEAVHGNVEGAGLGLYLARRIAELQGGTIEVSSRLGKGTKFVMILPQGDYGVTKGTAS